MKQSRLRDLQGKDATILDVLATLTSQARVTLYNCIVFRRMEEVIVCGFARLLQRRYLVSANTGWSLQILFPDYNSIGSTPKDRSIPTA